MNRASVLAIALMLSTVAWAQPGGPNCGKGPPPPPHEIIEDHAADLGVDAETVRAIQDIAERAKPEMHALHEAARAAHDALHEHRKSVMDEIMQELTPAQQTALKELIPPPPRHAGPGRGGPPPRR